MAFLRPAYYRDSDLNFRVLRFAYYGGKQRTGRPGTREKEIGFEIPEFPKPLAPALRFGSMNPITRLLVHGVLWPAYYGDSERILVFLRPAYHGDSEGYFRILKASLLWGNTAVAEITIGGWAKSYNLGGTWGGYCRNGI